MLPLSSPKVISISLLVSEWADEGCFVPALLIHQAMTVTTLEVNGGENNRASR